MIGTRMHLWRCVFLLVLVFGMPGLAMAVPTQLNHQGRLLDSDGIPVEGTLPVTFTLEDAPEGGDVLWSETLEVSFSDGYFSVRLGTDLDNDVDASLLSDEPLWLGLTVDGGDPLLPLQPVVSAPYAVRSDTAKNVEGGRVEASEVVVGGTTVIDADGNWLGGGDFAAQDHGHGDAGVPLGTVIDWFRPSPDIEIPEGYQVCDGAAISDPESPWFGYTVPDLIGRVSLGVVEEDVGAVGGSAEHQHDFDAAPHDHSINHDHGTISGQTELAGPGASAGSNSPVSATVVAVTTSDASAVTTSAAGSATTSTSSLVETGVAGDGLTSGTTVPDSGTQPAFMSSFPTNSTSGAASGVTGGSSDSTTTSSGTNLTGGSNTTWSGAGSGSTGSASSTSTSNAGTHNHEAFEWDQSLRRWKHFKSDGTTEVMIDFSPTSGVVDNPVGEDLIPLGSMLTVGDKTSYTGNDGSHSHVNSHTHAAGSHNHSILHQHSGPSHNHANEHDHDLGSHTHTQVHQHQVTAHEHSIEHQHLGPGHAHSMAHDHGMSDHQHELPHTHTTPGHDHDTSHDHDIAEHVHAAGGLSTQTHTGTTGAVSAGSSSSSDPASSLPPYVGLLKLMRIR